MMVKFDYKKSLGQNFLNDQNIINKIIDNIDAKQNDLIIEIGPGAGAITSKLSVFDCRVYSFEIDKRLKDVLSKYENNKLKVIYDDFMCVDLKGFLKDKEYNKLIFVGNLPYYITTPIINKITEESNPNEIIIMIQKEVGERFMAKPSTKEYSSISVHLQYNYKIEKICLVNKNCFIPSPKVDSIVIKLTKRKKEDLKDLNEFNKLIRDSFQFKRKNLKNNLVKYDLEKIEKLLIERGKNLTSRAEELSVQDFVYISNNIN